MLYGISTRSTCTCTATVCRCFDQGGTQATTIASNQIVVWVVVGGHVHEEPDLKIEPALIWEREPPPRYQRRPRPHFRFAPLRLTGKTEVRRAGRERGHAFGHSPRKQSRH